MRAACQIETVPEGWFTRAQLQESWKIGQSRAGEIIKNAIRSKKAERKNFRILQACGNPYPTAHYKFNL